MSGRSCRWWSSTNTSSGVLMTSFDSRGENEGRLRASSFSLSPWQSHRLLIMSYCKIKIKITSQIDCQAIFHRSYHAWTSTNQPVSLHHPNWTWVPASSHVLSGPQFQSIMAQLPVIFSICFLSYRVIITQFSRCIWCFLLTFSLSKMANLRVTSIRDTTPTQTSNSILVR